jgi:hypothetical protein
MTSRYSSDAKTHFYSFRVSKDQLAACRAASREVTGATLLVGVDAVT